jgi:hypothetical protein
VGQEDLLIIYLKYLMKRKLRPDRVTEITYAPGADATVAAEESKEEANGHIITNVEKNVQNA